jgi:catechol 2,3-dioxygenase-like lactoylglutathione lyase family enzyme
MSTTRSDQFDLRGFHHVALVCKDMQDTVDFYEGVLGFPLVKTLQLGDDGQHFFFQVTENDGVAFFWFRNVNPTAPGVASADWYAGETTPSRAKGLVSKAAPGAMHHLSFGVPEDKLEEYRDRLIEAGVEVTDVVTHKDENGEMIRSIYFRDPDGTILEFSAWAEPLAAGTSTFTPAAAADALARRREGVPYTV